MRGNQATSPLRAALRAGVLLALVGWILWGFSRLLGEPQAPDPVGIEDAGPRVVAGLNATPPPAASSVRAPASDGPPPKGEAVRDVALSILGPHGRAASRVWVQWWKLGGGFSSGRTDETGTIVLPLVDTSRPYRLQVMPQALGDEVLPYEDPAWLPRDTTVRLERALSITGTVLDEHGEPAVEHGVFWRVLDGDLKAHPVSLGEPGVFRIAPLRPGRYQVCAAFNDPWRPHPPVGFRAGDLPDGPSVRTVDAGTQGLRLRVSRGAMLRVKIEDWDDKTMSWGHVFALSRAEDPAVHRSELDSMGRVAFCRLPAEGLYRLRRFGLPGNRYVDADDLQTGRVVHAIRTWQGLVIRGHLTLPVGVPADRASVRAWQVVPGRDSVAGPEIEALVVQGQVEPAASRYVLQGLPRGRWQVRASASVLREGVVITLQADGVVSAGHDLDLVLAAD